MVRGYVTSGFLETKIVHVVVTGPEASGQRPEYLDKNRVVLRELALPHAKNL